MFRIIKNGASIGLTENLNYIKQAENGCYVLCPEPDASGIVYKCVQNHTSQADWTPDTASSLWSKTSDPAEEWPEWSQPVGAHDAYPKGAKVSHNSKHWISTAENNVWEPGVYGWEEVTNAV